MNVLLRLGVGLLVLGSSLTFAEPQNLGQLKHDIIAYYDSGEYSKELGAQIERARHYIMQQATLSHAKVSQKPLAIVLDIDETSLTNAKTIVTRDFAGITQIIHQDIMQANAPAIEPMLKLFNEAKAHDIKVFFVTGRNESERGATIKNLTQAGYSGWSGLYLRPTPYTYKSIIPFKSQARAEITKQGYSIIATIGDQYSDIKGGYAQKGFKLPNPFYYIR